MNSAQKPEGSTRRPGHWAGGIATLILVSFVMCGAELGRADGDKFKFTVNGSNSSPTIVAPQEMRSEGPFNFAITPDGYLLAQFTKSKPAAETDLHVESFWPGGQQGLDAPYNPAASAKFSQYALLQFLKSKQPDGRVACSDAAMDLLRIVNEEEVTPITIRCIMARYAPAYPATDSDLQYYGGKNNLFRAKYQLCQAAATRASGIKKIRAYFVGPDDGAAQCDVQKGELHLTYRGPSCLRFLLKRGDEYLSQFAFEDQPVSTISMNAAELGKLVQSGDRYAFIYEIEGRPCNNQERFSFIARKALPRSKNFLESFLLDVDTTRLYLLRQPAQSGGLQVARVSVLNTNVLPKTIAVAHQTAKPNQLPTGRSRMSRNDNAGDLGAMGVSDPY